MPRLITTLAITLAGLGREKCTQLKLIPSLNFTATDKEIGTLTTRQLFRFAFGSHSHFILCKKGGSGNRMPKMKQLWLPFFYFRLILAVVESVLIKIF
jgi:hypothetical protein